MLNAMRRFQYPKDEEESLVMQDEIIRAFTAEECISIGFELMRFGLWLKKFDPSLDDDDVRRIADFYRERILFRRYGAKKLRTKIR